LIYFKIIYKYDEREKTPHYSASESCRMLKDSAQSGRELTLE